MRHDAVSSTPIDRGDRAGDAAAARPGGPGQAFDQLRAGLEHERPTAAVRAIAGSCRSQLCRSRCWWHLGSWCFATSAGPARCRSHPSGAIWTRRCGANGRTPHDPTHRSDQQRLILEATQRRHLNYTVLSSRVPNARTGPDDDGVLVIGMGYLVESPSLAITRATRTCARLMAPPSRSPRSGRRPSTSRRRGRQLGRHAARARGRSRRSAPAGTARSSGADNWGRCVQRWGQSVPRASEAAGPPGPTRRRTCLRRRTCGGSTSHNAPPSDRPRGWRTVVWGSV